MKKNKSKILKIILLSIGVLTIAGFITIYQLKQIKPVQVLEGNRDCVVLLHGLGRTSSSMNAMAVFLNKEGFKTVNIDYPSTKYKIEKLSDLYLETAVKKYCEQADKIHFVTHSLGGIIVRYYLANNSLDNLGKVIMLAPPNQGSELVDYLRKSKTISWTMGPAFLELGTDPESLPLKLPEPYYDLYVIAGNKSQNDFFSKIIPGEDDGKVAVEKTKLKNLKGFLLLEEGHTYIMNSEAVKTAVKNFLEE